MVGGRTRFGDEWQQIGDEYTTARPQIVCIGPVGEARARVAALIHGSGVTGRQGGFGGVFGAKNLKAISVIGTSSIKIHDPKALMQARLWQKNKYGFDLDNQKGQGTISFDSAPKPGTLWGTPPGSSRPREGERPVACVGCHSGCRGRYLTGLGNEANCMTTAFYSAARSLDI